MIRHKRVLAAKVEATPGTAETLANADAAFNAFNVTIQNEIQYLQRDGRAAFARFKGATGERAGVVTFSHHWQVGSGGTHPAWFTTFMPACGWVLSGALATPRTEAPGSNVKTLTLGVYQDGILIKKLKGACGMWSMECVAGQLIVVNFTFRGIWVAPADGAILAPTYPVTDTLRVTGSGLTIGAYSPIFNRLSLDSGNVLFMRPNGNASDGSGLAYCTITDRVVTGTIDPESVAVATKDFYGEFIAHTEQALAANINNGATGVTVGAPKIQFTSTQEGDRGGIQSDDLTFQCNGDTSAGDDELSFTLDSTV